jgi:hypothetical protein
MALYHIGTITTHVIMNEISETYLRETSDGSIRYTTSSVFAKKFKHQEDAERKIKQLGLVSCKVIAVREPITIEVKS